VVVSLRRLQPKKKNKVNASGLTTLNSTASDKHKETECSQQCIDEVGDKRLVQGRGTSMMEEGNL
jgi:hypothetical protein